MTRVSRVTSVLAATLVAGALAVSVAPASSSAAPGGRKPARADAAPATFTISSFNVLGANHTEHSKKWDSGDVRIKRVNQLLERNHIDVAGFQELQASQLATFRLLTDRSWGFYPGLRLGRMETENSVGWRKDRFDLVQGTTVTIPYFNGTQRQMPLVLLREKATGMMLYVANYHNAAETGRYRNQGKWRAEATRIQIALQNQIYRQGIPRFVTGDMNERAPYFCRVASETPLKAARPETYVKGGVCHANRPRAVDWILGSRKVDFTNYVEDRSHLVDITTDHPVISADVTVSPERLPRAWDLTNPALVVPQVSYSSAR